MSTGPTGEDASGRSQATGPYPGDQGHRVICQQVVDLLGDFAEGALAPRLSLDVQAHLDVCPECQMFFDQLRITRSLVGQLPEPTELPEELVARLVAEFRDVIPP